MSSKPSTEPVKWLPVDEQLVFTEDFQPTPQQGPAMAEADRRAQSGDQRGAFEALKVAGVDVDFAMAVMPLAKTTAADRQLIGRNMLELEAPSEFSGVEVGRGCGFDKRHGGYSTAEKREKPAVSTLHITA